MRRALAALAALTLGLQALAAAGQQPFSTELAPGVHVHIGPVQGWAADGAADVANLGLVVGQRCAAVVDTGGSVAVGRAWRAEVQRLTDRPVCYVITTHAHPDHALGHAAFLGAGPGGADPQFVGHAGLARAQAARAEHDLRVLARDLGAEHAGTRSVPPGRAVATEEVLDLGGRRLLLRAWPSAHTDHDLTVWDDTSATLFTGDLWFSRHLPVLDGRVKGWLAVLDQLATLPARRAVPGHGEASTDWPNALAPQRRYLQGLVASVRQAIQDGWTLAETLQRLGPQTNQEWLLTNLFHRRNLSAAYAELEWE